MGHSPDHILTSALASPIAFVFPGQGSQSLGMLSEWADAPIIRKTFDEASEVLGYNVWELAQNGPEEQLNQTEYTQPVLLTASVALYRQWRFRRPETPVLFAGHSLGEYSALVCAGAINLQDGVNLVATRGRLMQRAVPEGMGAMAAIIGLSDEQARLACQQAMGSSDAKPHWVVAPANFNSPQQVVIAGSKEAVTIAMDRAKELGAKRVIPLSVSVPSHCALMSSAAEEFRQSLMQVEMRLPEIPVIQNVDVTIHASIEGIRAALISQLSKPVRWVECIEKMGAQGIKTIIECGPGLVLTGLNKRIIPEMNNISVQNLLERVVGCP